MADNLKDIRDSIDFPTDFTQAKKESLDQLCKDSRVMAFMIDNNLSREVMNSYWLELLNYVEDYPHCTNCHGIRECDKKMVGYRQKLNFDGSSVSIVIEPCEYQVDYLKDENTMNLIATNMPRNLFKKGFADVAPTISTKLTIELLKMMTDGSYKGVYVSGPTQIGKTVSLGLFAYYYAETYHKQVAMYNIPNLMALLKSSFNDEENNSVMILNRIKNADLLILDDIGGENFSSWSRDEIIGTIIEERILQGLPTCYTSIYTLTDLKDYYTTRQKGDNVKATRLTEKIRNSTNQITL